MFSVSPSVVPLLGVHLDDGEMSVFWRNADNVISVHPWAGAAAPRPSLLLSEQGLVVGDNALVLDEDLAKGMSRPSISFASPILLGNDNGFVCIDVELFVLE